MIVSATSPTQTLPSRGAFIVLEGVDRCGKTTQCGLLRKHLLGLGLGVLGMRFPDRTTAPVGTLIHDYLSSSKEMSDEAIHLLFSANRWEAVPTMTEALSQGTHIICDRYAHSGVAFSSAKPNLDMEWCKGPDVGLPAPDAVLFLSLSPDEAEARGGFGAERYEKRDMQQRVRQRFDTLRIQDMKGQRVPWYVINAAQPVDKVHTEVLSVVDKTIERVQQGAPLLQLWKDETYDLNKPAEPTA
mmetsp:Transcript_25417/g.59079  ORF Transcript_25417/g.59079 Transcript_25417/m.59079 type:complete len:243 (-) Transcript_25417:839-1567(-)